MRFKEAYTLASWYDQNSIGVLSENNKYRIKASEILKLLNKHGKFKLREARKHIYLEVA